MSEDCCRPGLKLGERGREEPHDSDGEEQRAWQRVKEKCVKEYRHRGFLTSSRYVLLAGAALSPQRA